MKCILLSLVILSLSSGCVSVSLNSKSPVRHAEVHLQTPTSPFTVLATDKSDQAWRNNRNGNSISYFSNCNDPADPAIEVVRNDMLTGIQDVTVLDSQTLQYNGREAVRTVATGKVDGVNAKMDVLVFKKNMCIYGLSFVGLTANYEADHAAFDNFVRGFVAP
jgi:hypothetical protein